jgi:hypothetical protein
MSNFAPFCILIPPAAEPEAKYDGQPGVWEAARRIARVSAVLLLVLTTVVTPAAVNLGNAHGAASALIFALIRPGMIVQVSLLMVMSAQDSVPLMLLGDVPKLKTGHFSIVWPLKMLALIIETVGIV